MNLYFRVLKKKMTLTVKYKWKIEKVKLIGKVQIQVQLKVQMVRDWKARYRKIQLPELVYSLLKTMIPMELMKAQEVHSCQILQIVKWEEMKTHISWKWNKARAEENSITKTKVLKTKKITLWWWKIGKNLIHSNKASMTKVQNVV